MAFSAAVKRTALILADERCQCTRLRHLHRGRCPKPLTMGNAQFHHKTAKSRGGDDSLSNCEVLCEECHRETESFGRH